MLAFATLLTVLSAEPTAVMVQSRSGMAADELKKALATVDLELARLPGAWTVDETQKRLKAAGQADVACAGKLPCLLNLATMVKARWLVTVSVSKIGRDRAWALAAVESASGTQLAVEEWLDAANADVSGPVSTFAKRLAPLLVVKDAPVAVSLDPTPPPPPPVDPGAAVVAEASRPLPKVLLISGAVVAAVAVGLAVGASLTAAPLNQVTTVGDLKLSSLTQGEAEQRKATANGLTGAAVAAGVVAAGLGVGAILTW